MTTHDRDKIIAAAKEAGLITHGRGHWAVCTTTELERFYAIGFEDGRQDEREKQIQEVSNAKNKTN